VVTLWVDEELERRVKIAVRFADGADVIGRVVSELGDPVAQHLVAGRYDALEEMAWGRK
jgi:hypothetical protein